MTQARIVVRPHPSYVAGTADPYHFLYLIEIENLGPGKVQLQVARSRALGDAVDRRQQTWSLAYLYEWDSTLDLYVVGMDDRVGGQTVGRSVAVGARYRF